MTPEIGSKWACSGLVFEVLDVTDDGVAMMQVLTDRVLIETRYFNRELNRID
jgi:hypothetical protein